MAKAAGPPSAPDAPGWVETSIGLDRGVYLVEFADFGEDWQQLAVEYDTREDLLTDIDAIEAFRHPADPRA